MHYCVERVTEFNSFYPITCCSSQPRRCSSQKYSNQIITVATVFLRIGSYDQTIAYKNEENLFTYRNRTYDYDGIMYG